MKITICGSITFYDEMQRAKEALENQGHEVDLPPDKVQDEEGNLIPVTEYYKIRKAASDNEAWVWERKKWAIKKHFNKVDWADAVLILNHEKNNVPGYIGANTLMEMGLALHLGKKIFLLHPVPEIAYKEELLGMQPIILENDLTKIN